MEYTITDLAFGILVTVVGGLVLAVIIKGFSWVNDLSKNVNENKRRLDDLESEIVDLEHKFEDALGARR